MKKLIAITLLLMALGGVGYADYYGGGTGQSGWPSIVNTYNQNAPPMIAFSANAKVLEDGSANTANDYTMATTWISQPFTASAADTIGSITFQAKASGTITNLNAKIIPYLYSYNTGNSQPGTVVAGAGSFGFPYGALTSSYQTFTINLTNITSGTGYVCTPGTTYCIVLKQNAAPVGGTVILNSSPSLTTSFTSSNGTNGNWTGGSPSIYFQVQGLTPAGVSIVSNNIGSGALSVTSLSAVAGSFNSYMLPAISAISQWHNAISGTSMFGNCINANATYGIGANITSAYGQVVGINQAGAINNTNNANPVLWITRAVSGTANTTGDMLQITDTPSTSGTIDGAAFRYTSSAVDRVLFYPRVADGATAVAAFIDTTSALANASAKLFSFRNNGVEKAYIGYNGSAAFLQPQVNGSAAVATGSVAVLGAIGAAGSNYTIGDLVTIDGGVGSLAVVKVLTVTGGPPGPAATVELWDSGDGGYSAGAGQTTTKSTCTNSGCAGLTVAVTTVGLTKLQVSNGSIYNTGQGSASIINYLPTAKAGESFIAQVGTAPGGSYYWDLKPAVSAMNGNASGDVMILDGTALTVAHGWKIVTPTVGEAVVCTSLLTDANNMYYEWNCMNTAANASNKAATD